MFRALDYVNYDTLKVRRWDNVSSRGQSNDPKGRGEGQGATFEPLRLQELSCLALNAVNGCSCSVQLLMEAVSTLPSHLITLLFRNAWQRQQTAAISEIVASWPFETFCLRELLDPQFHSDLFMEDQGFDLVMFRGLIHRKKNCKMKCFDLRGFKLNRGFVMLIVQLWPLISLSDRTSSRAYTLSRTIVKNARYDHLHPSAKAFALILYQRLMTQIKRSKDYRVSIPEGENLVVKIDSVVLSSCDSLYQDYLISNCLRDITPLKVQVSQLVFRTSSFLDRSDQESLLTPFDVLQNHDMEYVKGVSLRQLDDGVFKSVAPLLYRFKNLQAIELQDCNIYLQNGRTRSKTEDRLALCGFLSQFPHLIRLDLGFNYLAGCLGEVLDSIAKPLQYLGLRRCDLNPTDLEALSTSKHAMSLRELNLSKISLGNIHSFLEEPGRGPEAIVTALRFFPRLACLNLSQLNFTERQLHQLVSVVKNNLRELKVLDMGAVVMPSDLQLELCLACASIPTFQKVALTLVPSMLNELQLQGMAEDLAASIGQKVRAAGRPDIVVESVLFSRALFLDIVDDIQF